MRILCTYTDCDIYKLWQPPLFLFSFGSQLPAQSSWRRIFPPLLDPVLWSRIFFIFSRSLLGFKKIVFNFDLNTYTLLLDWKIGNDEKFILSSSNCDNLDEFSENEFHFIFDTNFQTGFGSTTLVRSVIMFDFLLKKFSVFMGQTHIQ